MNVLYSVLRKWVISLIFQVGKLKEFFLFEVDDFSYCDNKRNNNYRQITVPPFKLRHIGKVHTVPSRE